MSDETPAGEAPRPEYEAAPPMPPGGTPPPRGCRENVWLFIPEGLLVIVVDE